MNTKIIVILSVLLLLFIGLFAYSYTSSNSLAQKMLNEQKAKLESEYKVKIADLQTQIFNKESQMKIVERQKGILIERLRVKEQELQNIKLPLNVEETVKRLGELGYVVTVR